MTAQPSSSPAELDVPGYDVLERLGAGGFGEVFRARHRRIGREVAIKIIHERHSANPEAIARFIAEARAVNKISHPNIVEISDFGELANGRPYCVMELIHGETLRAILDARGPLVLAEAVPILRGIAEAIDGAHAAGIIHRDLKPDNVFVLADGSIKLIDFGLAKLMTEESSVTQTGHVFGTPLYMSPEQCRGRGITPATDAYSFGVLAYHVLAGAPPFSGEPLDLAVQHINEPPPRPTTVRAELPAHVDAPLLALLEKDPARRPAQLAAVVDALAGGRALPARRPWRWIAAGALLACAGAGVFVLTRSDPAREPAWTRRTLRLDVDGIVYNPRVTNNGSQLFYGDAAGGWRHDFATGRTIRLPITDVLETTTIDQLPDGRLLIGTGSPRATEILDLRDRSRVRLLDAGFASVSPDGRLVAAWDAGDNLVVHELATHQTRRLFHLPDAVIESAPVWSPDGTQLVFGRNGALRPARPIVFVTNLVDGTTRPLPHAYQPRLRNATTDDYFNAVAFLRDGRIAYCTDNPVRVVARPLWGIVTTTLAELDSSVSDCMIAARGDGLVVTAGRSQSTAALFEPSPPTSTGSTAMHSMQRDAACAASISRPVRSRPSGCARARSCSSAAVQRCCTTCSTEAPRPCGSSRAKPARSSTNGSCHRSSLSACPTASQRGARSRRRTRITRACGSWSTASQRASARDSLARPPIRSRSWRSPPTARSSL
jgi:serine/threonine protein kinase